MLKGIQTWAALHAAFDAVSKQWGQAYVETDMRAMHNPLRMETIKAATLRLIDKLNNHCPRCGAPGFELIGETAGLPCSLCSKPTASAVAATHHCQHCRFEASVPFPLLKTSEDPMYCTHCNP